MPKKTWILKNKGRPITKEFENRRNKEINDNQLASKLLVEELYESTLTEGSKLWLYQKIQRGDGATFRPVLVDVGNLLSFELNLIDELDAFAAYLPSQIHEEGDATSTYASDETFTEGDATTNYLPVNPF